MSTVPTKERLAQALRDAGAPDLATRADTGEFSDFQSWRATPKALLVGLLKERGLNALAVRIIMGEFDDNKEEAERWWQDEGKRLFGGGRGV